MPKVQILRAFAKDTFYVSPTLLQSGYVNGTAFTLNSLGQAIQGSGDNVIFIGADAQTELSTPPSGSLITGVYGSGTKILIDHTPEVQAGSNARAYAAAVESAQIGALLYIGADGKWTTASTDNTFVKGVLFQKPAASNNYTLGVILRF